MLVRHGSKCRKESTMRRMHEVRRPSSSGKASSVAKPPRPPVWTLCPNTPLWGWKHGRGVPLKLAL